MSFQDTIFQVAQPWSGSEGVSGQEIIEQVQAAIGGDDQVKVSEADTGSGFLIDKIVTPAPGGLQQSIQGAGGFEGLVLQINTGVNNSQIPQLVAAGARGAVAAAIEKRGVTGAQINENTAGNVGEFISSSVSRPGIVLVAGIGLTITSINLTAGDWDIAGCVGYAPTGTTEIDTFDAAISDANNTMQDAETCIVSNTSGLMQVSQSVPTASTFQSDLSLNIPMHRCRITGNTTFYLVARAAFAVSTLGAYGSLWARRVR